LRIDPAVLLLDTPALVTTRHLLRQLHSGDVVTQYRAIVTLANPLYASDEVVLALLGKLRDRHWHIQKASANTLEALGEAAVPCLHKLLTASHLATREQAAAGLHCLGPLAAPAAETLVRSLASTDFAIDQRLVAQALYAVRQMTLPYLLELLEQRPSEKIAWVLREIWTPATAIESMLSNPHEDVRYWALHALRGAAPSLSLLLHDPSERIRHKVVETLRQQTDLEPAGEAALIQALHDPAPKIRDLALGRLLCTLEKRGAHS
jgi:HEAT repeat protein